MRIYVRNRAFSLVELLVVVAILGVLAGAILGVGRRIKTQAEEKLARSTISILVSAIEQYHSFWGHFPAEEGYDPAQRGGALYRQLYVTPEARALCASISETQFGDTNGDDLLEVLDPWSEPIDYHYTPGWTFPELLSGGPDGDPNRVGDNVPSE